MLNITKELYRDSVAYGDWRSSNDDPSLPSGQIVISGDFGDPPPVVIFADWSNLTDGATLNTSAANVGEWTAASYATGLYPKAITAAGFTGASLREGGTNPNVDNRLTGFVKTFPAKKNFLVAYEIAVPSGRAFPGSATEGALPIGTSTCKPIWLSDQGLDEFAKADVVAGSWIGSNFAFLGNSVPYNMSMGGNFDFSGFNGRIVSAVTGADPFADNASLMALACNSNIGTVQSTKTDIPAFFYREGYKVTRATTGTVFSATIKGTLCSYTQQVGDATDANVATGLKAAIDAQSISGITTIQVGSQVLVDATLRTTFSSTVSAGIVKVQMQPQYTHFNAPAWSGEGVQDLAQLAYKYVYFAAADDDSVNKRVELLDNADYSLSTIHRAIYPTEPEDYWTDGVGIAITPSATLRDGATHWCVTMPNGTQTIGAI